MENDEQSKGAVYMPETRNLIAINDAGNPVNGCSGDIAERKYAELCNSNADVDVRYYKPTEADNAHYRRNNLIRHIHSLLAIKGLQNVKEDILAKYGAAHTSDLTIEQLQQLSAELQQCDVSKPVREARSQVLSLLSDGFCIRAENGDWSRVNVFLCNPRIAGKELYKMNVEELRKCALRLRMIIRKNKTHPLPF
jgi:HPt (histidine-containing phosphotransfer) domain-containing protein